MSNRSQWIFTVGVWLLAAPVFLALALSTHGVLRVLALVMAVASLLNGIYQWRTFQSRSSDRSASGDSEH